MKTVSAAFLTMLQTSEFLVEADLYTITLQNGTVLRYTSAQLPITYNGNVYDAAATIQPVTAVAQPFFTGDGSATSAHLVGPNGESVTSAATVTAMHQTDWQGRVALSNTPRTNWLRNSQAQGAWTAQGVTVTAAGGVAPDGTNTLNKILQDTSNGMHRVYESSSEIASIGDFTALFVVAAGNAKYVDFSLSDSASGSVDVLFDLTSGSVISTGISGKWTNFSYGVTKLANGAFMAILTGTKGDATQSCVPLIYHNADGVTFNQSFAGDGTTYLYGWATMVLNGRAAGVYIPTTSAPVTVTDYAVDSSGNVTLGQSPAVDATLDWDGSGSTGNYAPGFVRGSTKCAVGLESDDLEVDILFDTTTLLSGQNPAAFVAAGGLDNAVLRLDKALAPDWSNPVVNGVVNLFTGYIGETKIEQGKISLTVASRVKVLNTSFPRNYFLPQDNNALFSAASGLNQASYAVSGTVTTTGGSPTATTFSSNCTNPDGWFSLGSVTWTSGANVGLTSFVKWYGQANGAFTLVYPIKPPSAGDTFTAYPGYDRTQATCQTKFNNLAHFRGFPFVPTPETLELGQAGSPPRSIGGGGGAGVGGIGRGPGGQAGRLLQR